MGVPEKIVLELLPVPRDGYGGKASEISNVEGDVEHSERHEIGSERVSRLAMAGRETTDFRVNASWGRPSKIKLLYP